MRITATIMKVANIIKIIIIFLAAADERNSEQIRDLHFCC